MIDLEASISKWEESQKRQEQVSEGKGAERILKSIGDQMEVRERKVYDTIRVSIFFSGAYSVGYAGGVQHRSHFKGDYLDIGEEVVKKLSNYSRIIVKHERRGNEFIIIIKLKKT